MVVLFLITHVVISLVFQFTSVDPDRTDLVREELIRQRQQLSQMDGKSAGDVLKMVRLGMLDEAKSELTDKNSADWDVVKGWLFYHKNEFAQAEKAIANAGDDALVLRIALKMQAWLLDDALALCEKRSGDPEVAFWKGKIQVLKKDYAGSLETGRTLQQTSPDFFGGYYLEADYHIWQQDPAAAEPFLRESLLRAPFDADSRFLYGYAIWRRVDATQLVDMAAQWELALEVDPYHYMTHWHWGNGHTHLTYRDYAAPDDAEVREKLETAESLFSNNQIEQAIQKTRDIGTDHPGSVLPDLYRASYYYSAFDQASSARLDSALNIFSGILDRKPHYGPAHNGLASVVRAKRMPFIAIYDSVMHALAQVQPENMRLFASVFPDMDYYPGETVRNMAWSQLFTSKAYLPMLSRLGRTFVIPPLHKDLTIAMNSPFFRQNTTFDNRQWMDIRGVGSGAAAIEYVEKAAFLDRNVLLHEYVHLFHGTVLTDSQVRRIRELYYAALEHGRTLDYYAANNESEYFAQIYPAYFSPQKVHPLDFKSTNTHTDLKQKDPEGFAFVEELYRRETAALAGDTLALADNWAQMYVLLSRQAGRREPELAKAYLDSSLHWQHDYVPAMLAYADLSMREGDLIAAENWIAKADERIPGYAPSYLVRARLAAFLPDSSQALAEQENYLRLAFERETDHQEKAGIARSLYTFLRDQAKLREAIAVAEEYAETGSSASTYLRDRLDDAAAFAASLRSGLGDASATETLAGLVRKKPQNYGFRKMYSVALAASGNYEQAILNLEEVQRILIAAGTPRQDFQLHIAAYVFKSGDRQRAASLLSELSNFQASDFSDVILLMDLTADLGSLEQARGLFNTITRPQTPYALSDYLYAGAMLSLKEGDLETAKHMFGEAVQRNPYHHLAADALVELMQR